MQFHKPKIIEFSKNIKKEFKKKNKDGIYIVQKYMISLKDANYELFEKYSKEERKIYFPKKLK